jgi:hypothetical protein
VIRVDAVWMAVQPLDMRVGTEAALARVVGVFGAAHPHHAYLFTNRRANRMIAGTRRCSSPMPNCFAIVCSMRWLVVGAEPITSVDVTSADALDELDTTLHESGIDLRFAELKGPVKDKLKRFGLFSRLGEQRFFATLCEAVSRYLESQSVAWVDWQDRVAGASHDHAQDGRPAGSVGPPPRPE